MAGKTSIIKKGLSHKEVRGILEHRYPFLLVDKIIELEEDTILGIKNVSASDPYLSGHFPDDPIYPGVLLIETCSQVGGILVSKYFKGRGVIAQIKNFKFLNFIEPGDTIKIRATYKGKIGNFAQITTEAFVENRRVAKGEVTYSFTDKN